MNSTQLLLTRQSTAKLTNPAPKDDELALILNSGMRVPDHGGLTPWHFTVVTASGLTTLSDIFVKAAKNKNLDDITIAKAEKMPFRAPLIIIISSQIVEHDKVPKQEQLIAAGCCVHAMQMAAFSMGYGGMWRTGKFAYDDNVKQQLAIDTKNEIMGFLYIGTPQQKLTQKRSKSYGNYVSYL